MAEETQHEDAPEETPTTPVEEEEPEDLKPDIERGTQTDFYLHLTRLALPSFPNPHLTSSKLPGPR